MDRGIAFRRARILEICFLISVLALALAGCATSGLTPEQRPPVHISERTWHQVDSEISTAALVAAEPAKNYARGTMETWKKRVAARTEAEFIPWFTGYWTQQWLSIRVAWYRLGSADGADQAVDRLAAYLQEQYLVRVLQPVAREIDPDVVRVQATRLYVQLLAEQLQGIARRNGVPVDQFERRIGNIPAISLGPQSTSRASLYQIVHADPLAGLPAFKAMIAEIRKTAGSNGLDPTDGNLSPVARRASEKLLERLAVSGSASAASAVVGGIPGIIISLGAAGFGVISHQSQRQEMEAELKESLDAAVNDMWSRLVEDPASGLMAGIIHISQQIEAGVARVLIEPVELVPLPLEGRLPDGQPH